MEHNSQSDAKARILHSALNLFAQKGFDATRVSEIAQKAGVTKALIYYYFKSKEDLLSHLVHTLLEKAASITLDFVHTGITRLAKEGLLEVQQDRLHLVDEGGAKKFTKSLHDYFERVVDFVIENRQILRIFLAESLKSKKGNNGLSQLLDCIRFGKDKLPANIVSACKSDFRYTDEMVLFKLFFSVIPLLTFAAYFDDYQTISQLPASALRAYFLQSLYMITSSFFSGREILSHSKAGGDDALTAILPQCQVHP
ncbi:MAG: TetR/AcrR family transcriptional regulator [Firmicutes bacterium]|nr:TetR/AcrR family transcriptional regulator [Bacillota bacterium]